MNEAAWIEAIAEDPTDLARRLVFADWLMERNDRRGELMRLQYEVRTAEPRPDIVRRLEKLERELSRRMERICGAGMFRFDAATGLPASVTVSAASFLEKPQLVFRMGPILSLYISDVDGRLDAVLASPYLRWTFGLSLAYVELTDAGVAALAASPYLSRLRSLELRRVVLGEAGVRALAGQSLPPLARLEMAACDLGVGGVEVLAAAPWWRQLRALDLGDNQLTASVLPTMFSAPLAKLRVHDAFGPDLGRAIAAAGHLSPECLLLADCQLGDEGALALASAPHLASVRTLSLGANRISEQGMTAVQQSPHLRDARVSFSPLYLPEALPW